MASYRGIGDVDSAERFRHRALTSVLWASIVENGVAPGWEASIDCVFVASRPAEIDTLVELMASWPHSIEPPERAGEPATVRVCTPSVVVSEAALLELTDVALVAADESGCRFDGLALDLSEQAGSPRRS